MAGWLTAALNSDGVPSGIEHRPRWDRQLDRHAARLIADAIAEEAARRAREAGLPTVPEV